MIRASTPGFPDIAIPWLAIACRLCCGTCTHTSRRARCAGVIGAIYEAFSLNRIMPRVPLGRARPRTRLASELLVRGGVLARQATVGASQFRDRRDLGVGEGDIERAEVLDLTFVGGGFRQRDGATRDLPGEHHLPGCGVMVPGDRADVVTIEQVVAAPERTLRLGEDAALGVVGELFGLGEVRVQLDLVDVG